MAQLRRDMPDVIAILIYRTPLATIGLNTIDPDLGSLGNRNAFAGRCVHPLANINLDGGVIFVGVFLALERPDMRAAILVGIVNDPCLTLFAPFCSPLTLADGHISSRHIHDMTSISHIITNKVNSLQNSVADY